MPNGPFQTRLPLILLAVVVVLVGIWQIQRYLDDPTLHPPDDIVEYWAAGRLNLAGQNPYDSRLLVPLQKEMGRPLQDNRAIQMWNPPWTLAVVMPLALLPPRWAQLVWLLLNLGLLLGCAAMLWRLYGGRPERMPIALAVAAIFAPSLISLWSGQISIFLLVGFVGYLAYERERPFLAGVLVALAGIKPHLFHLFWLAVTADALWRPGRWRVIAGGLSAGGLATLIALAFNPAVLSQYVQAMTVPQPLEVQRPLAESFNPTLGFLIRWAVNIESLRLQFIPTVLAVLAFPLLAWRYRDSWDWRDGLPGLLLLTMLTAPYGAWPYDLVVLLPAVMCMAVWLSEPDQPSAWTWVIAGLYAVGCWVQLRHEFILWHIWVTPTLLLAYTLAWRTRKPRAVTATAE